MGLHYWGGRKPWFSNYRINEQRFGLDKQRWAKYKSSTFISIFIIS
jgi:lipopolysaccharide biosynthesis glycosyltransferase